MSNPYKFNLNIYSTHQIIIKNIGINRRVLDVGCNDGYIGKFSDPSNEFCGLDYDPTLIKKAQKIYSHCCVYDLNNSGDLKKIPFKGNFDVIVFADVLEHLLDPEKILAEMIKKYLAKKGKVIISLPNVGNWMIRIKLFFGRFDYTKTGILDETHLHLYTYRSAKKLAASAGLRIIREIPGASKLGFAIRLLPFCRGLLSTNIILICEK